MSTDVQVWLDLGLQPRAVSRDLDWGIPVPVEGADGKVLYVWFDAPGIGYISQTTIDLVGDDYEKWWKDQDTRMIHFIGKDNIVFHCIVFPAMLMADGSFNLPDSVPANGIPESRGRQDIHPATGRYGSTNICATSPAKRTCCATCSRANARDQGQQLHLEGFSGAQQQ